MRRHCALACLVAVSLIPGSLGLARPTKASPMEVAAEKKELVLMHVPYNFGHTIEKVAAFGNGPMANMGFGSNYMMNMLQSWMNPLPWASSAGDFQEDESEMITMSTHKKAINLAQYFGRMNESTVSRIQNKHQVKRIPFMREIWGAMDPILMQKSQVGCPLYLTPQKYWPEDVAKHYFGKKTVFGVIRDPLERLVSEFRGSIGGETGGSLTGNYGGDFETFGATCDLDGAITKLMRDYIRNRYDDPFMNGCAVLPQVDFLEGKYGITEAVDNRRFPMSMNEVLKKNGYKFEVKPGDIMHVTGCPDKWAGSINPQTKAMVHMVYKQDYDFLCTKFGYCKPDEDTCLQYISGMCPKNMTLVRKPLFELPFGIEIFPAWPMTKQGTVANGPSRWSPWHYWLSSGATVMPPGMPYAPGGAVSPYAAATSPYAAAAARSASPYAADAANPYADGAAPSNSWATSAPSGEWGASAAGVSWPTKALSVSSWPAGPASTPGRFWPAGAASAPGMSWPPAAFTGAAGAAWPANPFGGAAGAAGGFAPGMLSSWAPGAMAGGDGGEGDTDHEVDPGAGSLGDISGLGYGNLWSTGWP